MSYLTTIIFRSIFLSFGVVFCSFFVNAQETIVCDSIYAVYDIEPEFEGGVPAMIKWLLDSVSYEQILVPEESSERGKFYFVLSIDSAGEVLDLTMEGRPAYQDLKQLRESAPEIVPGKRNGVPVCTELRIPLNINLN